VAVPDPDRGFSRLLLRHRVRSGLTQQQLATRVGVHLRSIQGWECGISHPGADRLRALVVAFVENGALALDGQDAEALWDAALRDAPRLREPFDRAWFAALGGDQPALTVVAKADDARRDDWGSAPDVTRSVGRISDLATLRGWVLDERCRVVQLLGMGGIGKTTLATLLARQLAAAFEHVWWRSLRLTPTASEWLGDALHFLLGDSVLLPDDEDERITLLVQVMGDRRCLVVLDNLEVLLEPGDRLGSYRASFDGFRRFLQAVAERAHQSCVIVTSREAPPEFGMSTNGPVRSLEMRGLSVAEAQMVVEHQALSGSDLDWVDFVTRCDGNPLALKMTAETIRLVFGTEISAFLLTVGSNGLIHGGVERLLASQLDQRLSAVEQDVLCSLARTRERATPTARLLGELGPRVGRGAVIEAVQALRRRCLIEPGQPATGFSLHPVVRDYVASQLAVAHAG
jgi:transcriptional regulator with XRE-family HTH domain